MCRAACREAPQARGYPGYGAQHVRKKADLAGIQHHVVRSSHIDAVPDAFARMPLPSRILRSRGLNDKYIAE